MDDLDAYRCAKLLLDWHSQDAAVHAALRADALAAAGHSAWLRILAAVDELSRVERLGSEALQ